MSDQKASFAVRVCGVVVKDNPTRDPQILVVVYPNQEKHRLAAKLPADSPVLVVGLPGGNVTTADTSLGSALLRCVKQKTGCDAEMVGNPLGPYEHIKPPSWELTWGCGIKLKGEFQPTAHHRWVTLDQLESETEIQFSGEGKKDSMFKIAKTYLKHLPTSTPAIESQELEFEMNKDLIAN